MRTLFALAVGVALAAPSAASAQAKPPGKIKLAVMDIRPLGADKEKAELLSEVALTEAGNDGRFDVIGRSDIQSMLGFQKQKAALGCSDDASCIAEIGGALGVDYIVVGSIGKLGSLYRLDIKLVESKKAKVFARAGDNVEGREEELVKKVQKLVHDVLAKVPPRPGDAVAEKPPEKPADKPADKPKPRPDDKVAAVKPPDKKPDDKLAAKPPDPSTEIKDEPKGGGLTRRTGAYIAGGAGAACLAGGALMGGLALSADNAEKAATDVPTYESNKSSAKSRALVADILYGAGVVGLGVGAFLFFTGDSGSGAGLAVIPTAEGASAHAVVRF
jgi:TolB-like protein